MNLSNTLVHKHTWGLTHNVDSIHADAGSLDLVKDYLEQTKNKTVMCYLTSIRWQTNLQWTWNPLNFWSWDSKQL